MKNEDILKGRFIDILFEGRNKRYGAYYLRTHYDRYLLTGFLISCGSLILLLLLPTIIAFFQPSVLNNDDVINMQVETAPLPKGILTPEYIPPPPPVENINIPPKIVRDSIPIEKPEEKKKIDLTDNTSTNKNNKDTTQKSQGSGSTTGDPNQITFSIEQRPTLTSGGYSSIVDYIKKNTQYPVMEKVLGRHGQVIVTTTVNADGTLSDTRVSKSISPALDAEALRIVKSMPRLNPATHNGKAVRIYLKIPVDFQLPGTVQK